MKAASLNEIKKELATRNHHELLGYCLRLAKYKKENKELLDFLLFQSEDISAYTEEIKGQTSILFEEINMSNIFFIKKSIRKILRFLNRQIRVILSRQAEAELLIHFCNCFTEYQIPVKKSRQLVNLYQNQVSRVHKAVSTLHPDLQHDLLKLLKENA